MTQPQHPFTDLPEGAEVSRAPNSVDWRIRLCYGKVIVEYRHDRDEWITSYSMCDFHTVAPTPNEAFQALRQAVRELATDLGVV